LEKLPKSSFEFDDNFQVWRLLKPKKNSLLFIELRNAQELETVFVCVNFSNNEIVWDDLSFENSWSYSLSHCNSDYLFIKEFIEDDQPIVKAILCIEIKTKSMVWYKENCNIEEVFDDGTLLINEKRNDDSYERKFINPENGDIIIQIPIIDSNATISDILTPYSYKENSNHFNTIKTFIKEQVHVEISKDCDYLEFNSYIIIGIYTLDNQKVDNYIFVFSTSGELLHKDILGSNLKGIASDTFFITQYTLIYIKEKKEIITLYLKSES